MPRDVVERLTPQRDLPPLARAPKRAPDNPTRGSGGTPRPGESRRRIVRETVQLERVTRVASRHRVEPIHVVGRVLRTPLDADDLFDRSAADGMGRYSRFTRPSPPGGGNLAKGGTLCQDEFEARTTFGSNRAPGVFASWPPRVQTSSPMLRIRVSALLDWTTPGRMR